MTKTNDAHWKSLTDEQCLAAVGETPRRFIEAFPGSGKTTVASQRFGFLRYGAPSGRDTRLDGRAVVAASFTRAATWELRRRIQRHYGPRALVWPHRVITLDTLIHDAVIHLLETKTLIWPSGHTQLEVHDSWQVITPNVFTKAVNGLEVIGQDIIPRRTFASERNNAAPPAVFSSLVHKGVCTHGDIRAVLAQALAQPPIGETVKQRFAATIRALIVDEVFDANELDLQVIMLAADANVDITLVGDPWQALYGFRGARPDLVNGYIQAGGVRPFPLTTSFRWRTIQQSQLAIALRSGHGVSLPQGQLSQSAPDVILGGLWKDLWGSIPRFLPLAFQSPKGNVVEAASTLLLNTFTVARFEIPAVFMADALATLGVTELADSQRLKEDLLEVLQMLPAATTRPRLKAVYDKMVQAVQKESRREFPSYHGAYGNRLKLIRERVIWPEPLIPAMTIHQAKGREWDVVGLQLTDTERLQLTEGLSADDPSHRRLYVAATRARYETFAV